MRTSVVMNRCVIGLLLSAAGLAQTAGRKTAAESRPKETFWQWVLRFSGVSANPSTLKGAGDEPAAGQVWVADLASGAIRKVTAEDGYRSPVFYPNGAAILALAGSDVVTISAGTATRLHHVAGITKLVGFSLDDPDQVLMLKEDEEGHPSVARISVKTGAVVPLPFDARSNTDRQMLEALQGWQRTYGATTIYVKREPVETLSGTAERSNVFVKPAGRDPRNVSRCDTADCGQPSLSADGNRVLFIKGGL